MSFGSARFCFVLWRGRKPRGTNYNTDPRSWQIIDEINFGAKHRRRPWVTRRGNSPCRARRRDGSYSQNGLRTSPKNSVAIRADVGMLRLMDWQEMSALGIVAATAGLFAWQRLRPRRFRFGRGTPCGCASASASVPAPSITYHARKGEPLRVVVRSK